MKDKKDIKIFWFKILKNEFTKQVVKEFVFKNISFNDMKIDLIKKSPSLIYEVEKMNKLGELAVYTRARTSLNSYGTPISGFRKCVDFYPFIN